MCYYITLIAVLFYEMQMVESGNFPKKRKETTFFFFSADCKNFGITGLTTVAAAQATNFEPLWAACYKCMSVT